MQDDLQAVHKLNEAYQRIVAELGKVIVGQKAVIEERKVRESFPPKTKFKFRGPIGTAID